MPQLLAVEPPELSCHEFQVFGSEGESLDFRDGLHRAGGRREDDARTGVEGPCEELLPAEVAGAYAARVEKTGPATVSGVRV